MNKCPKCGKEADSKFCPECGSLMNVEEKKEVEQTTEFKGKTVECKTCGKQIAKSAAVCPYCGAKQKKPIYKRAWFILLCVLIVAVAAIKIIGVVNSGSPATIKTNDGNTVKMKASELMDLHDENEALFKKTYDHAPIEFVGTVESVESDTYYDGANWSQDSIVCKEGWDVKILHDSHSEILEKLKTGDKIRVKAEIVSAFGMNIEVGSSFNEREGRDDTIIEIL